MLANCEEKYYNNSMRILGIDPGMAIVGWAVLDFDEDKPVLAAAGSIQTDKKNLTQNG